MNPDIIERADKIGIGTIAVSDVPEMLSDVERVGANWFYTWAPRVADWSFDGWKSGPGVSAGGAWVRRVRHNRPFFSMI